MKKYQTNYNSPTSFALLQVFLYLMDGEELTYEIFEELTGLKIRTYYLILNHVDKAINDFKMNVYLQRREISMENNKTAYKAYYYKLLFDDDFEYTPIENMTDEERKLYLPLFTYLKLRNKVKVSQQTLSVYFPDITSKTFLSLISKLRETIGEELYKDHIQSYIIENID